MNAMPVKTKKEKSSKETARMARISSAFKALSNETRLAVFEQVRLGQCSAMMNEDNRPSVCCVASNFNISLSTISHHLKELRNAGLIDCERKGQSIYCEPNDETIKMMIDYLTQVMKK